MPQGQGTTQEQDSQNPATPTTPPVLPQPRERQRFSPFRGLRTQDREQDPPVVRPGQGANGLLGGIQRQDDGSGLPDTEPEDDETDDQQLGQGNQGGQSSQGDEGDDDFADDGQEEGGEPGSGRRAQPAPFQQWFNTLTEDDRRLAIAWHDDATLAQQEALNNERNSRRALEKQLRKIGRNADAQVQAQIQELTDLLHETDRRASFFQEATHPGVGLVPGAFETALIVATNNNFIDRAGKVDWDGLRADHPYLFQQLQPAGDTPPRRRAAPVAHAGSGLGQPVPPAPATQNERMNSLFRSQARR